VWVKLGSGGDGQSCLFYPQQQTLQVSFQGKFQIATVRHVGNFRQPTGDAWVTVFEAAPLQLQAL
jgi:hypothetical protein